MKIKFENNENNEINENDLFVKKGTTKENKNKTKQQLKQSDRSSLVKMISIILFIILLITILIFFILFNIYGNGNLDINIENIDAKQDKETNSIEAEKMEIDDNSIIYYNKTMSRRESLLKGKKYIRKCLKDDIHNFEKVENPKITVIIPVYNCEKTIKYAISSIQNQNMTDIEIILINDFSKDNSLNLIQEYQKKDKRIIIINNEKNMGSLYSRSIGILKAKGVYIFALDNDDMFFDEDLFDVIHKIAIRGEFDIVGFKALNVGSYKDDVYKMFDGYFSFKKNNLILHQPKLGLFPVTTNGRFAANDYTIWGKCIRTEIYKKAVNALGKERYSMFLSWCEDTSIVFVIFNLAQSYIFVHKYGIFHIKNNSTATKTQPKDNKLLGEIFLLDILFEFSKNNSNKNIAVSHLINANSRYHFSHIKNNATKLYLKSILEKMLKCKLISKMKHYQIKQIYKKVIK